MDAILNNYTLGTCILNPIHVENRHELGRVPEITKRMGGFELTPAYINFKIAVIVTAILKEHENEKIALPFKQLSEKEIRAFASCNYKAQNLERLLNKQNCSNEEQERLLNSLNTINATVFPNNLPRGTLTEKEETAALGLKRYLERLINTQELDSFDEELHALAFGR